MTKRLRPRATAVVVRDDRLLLVSDRAGIFMLPGGGVEPGERPEAAAARSCTRRRASRPSERNTCSRGTAAPTGT